MDVQGADFMASQSRYGLVVRFGSLGQCIGDPLAAARILGSVMPVDFLLEAVRLVETLGEVPAPLFLVLFTHGGNVAPRSKRAPRPRAHSSVDRPACSLRNRRGGATPESNHVVAFSRCS